MNAQKFITEANIHQVCKLLSWSDLDYKTYQNEMGMTYIKEVVGSDDWGADHLIKTPLFWRWWINHWNQRDQEFLIYAEETPEDLRLEIYFDLNAIEGFEFYPHRIIMEQSYAILMDAVNERSLDKQNV